MLDFLSIFELLRIKNRFYYFTRFIVSYIDVIIIKKKSLEKNVATCPDISKWNILNITSPKRFLEKTNCILSNISMLVIVPRS